jgi:hypothetical protein
MDSQSYGYELDGLAIKPRTPTAGEIQNASSSHERRLKRDRNQSFWETVSRYADRDTQTALDM